MSIKLTIMGCGNSAGVPYVGNEWGSCDPNNPKNNRLRPSILLQKDGKNLVVDTGPDFKQQINTAGVEAVDAVIYTHAHSDHIVGMDDLRMFRYKQKELIDAYGFAETLEEMENRFDYIFNVKNQSYPTLFNAHKFLETDLNAPFSIKDFSFIPFEQNHGHCRSLGLRFGNVAYCTDVASFSDDAVDVIKGVDVWIVDAAGYKMEKNVSHMALRDVIKLNETIGAKKVYLTHMSNQMDYETVMNETPEAIEPAYDGLVIEVTGA